MFITELSIKNYKAFKEAKIDNLSRMSVFLGPNASGKSTLFDVFGFLRDALKNNVTKAFQQRGGPREVFSRGCDIDEDLIEIQIKFRNPGAFEDNKNPLITYEIHLGWEQARAVVRKELLKYRRGQHGKPWHFLDFENGAGKAITNEDEYGKENAREKREDRALAQSDIWALKGLGQFNQYRTLSEFRSLLENWFVFNFSVDAARRVSETGLEQHLNETGDNVAQVTQYLHDYKKDILDEALRKLPLRIPGIVEVVAKTTEEGNVVLYFKDENFEKPFVGKFVSDGTIKMFAYMILLHDPEPFPLVCIEEPENYLHLDLLPELADEIRMYAEKKGGGQVFVSTHSPDFVNALKPEELFILVKEEGFTQVKPASEIKMVKELYEENNQLGWLWRGGYIPGANLNK